MGDNILERLDKMAAHAQRGRTVFPRDILREGAAEIVRLRGEVERWKALAEDAQAMHETALEVDALVADIDAIAPAEAKGDGRPAHPEGDVLAACVCGSWPGGKCLRCEWIPTPAAVPAGEAVAVVDVSGYLSWLASYLTSPNWKSLPEGTKLYTHPQPADGEAVATVCAAARARFGPAAHPHAVADWIEEQFRATPPAAQVQGLPSRELAEARAAVTAAAMDWGRNLVEGGADAGKAAAFDDAVERLERATLAAFPSACELGELEALREFHAAWKADNATGPSQRRLAAARDRVAALQHRGDSRGGNS